MSDYWITADERTIIGLSLWVAFWSTLLAMPFAVLVAFCFERLRFWGRSLCIALTFAPLVLPPVVTGYLLLVVFAPTGGLGALLASLGITLAFDAKGAALAAAVMAFPLFVRSVQIGLAGVDRNLEKAATTLGAGPFRVFFSITLPLMFPAILGGAVLAFAKALGEFGATITFVSNIPGETQTIASAIYAMLQIPGQEPAVLRLIGFSMVLSVLTILVAEWLARKGR